jgi:hypothetical protein
MLILFALGVMSILWMAIVAATIFLQKVLPFGRRLTWAVAVGLVAVGIWVAAAPGSVPGLVDPSTAPAMQMDGGTNKMGGRTNDGSMQNDGSMRENGSMQNDGMQGGSSR